MTKIVKSAIAGQVKNRTPPTTEMKILELLADMGGEAHAPAIARASSGAISIAAIYSLLKRLEQREMVKKREVYIPVGDIQAKRVYYTLNKNDLN